MRAINLTRRHIRESRTKQRHVPEDKGHRRLIGRRHANTSRSVAEARSTVTRAGARL